MIEAGRLSNEDVVEELAIDVIAKLRGDLSLYDNVFAKYAYGRRGRSATIMATLSSHDTRNVFSSLDLGGTLFPELEREELQVAMHGFANYVGSEYMYYLFDGAVRENRPRNKCLYTDAHGEKVSALEYFEYTWVPSYAEAFAEAANLGLTKEIALDLIVPETEAMK